MDNVKKYANTEKCCGCGVCALVCNKHAITMKADDSGFLQPFVDNAKCINCGLCVQKCPFNGSKIEFEYSEDYYYGYSKDTKTLKESTSGGIASELYKNIIQSGGKCFGVKYKNDCKGTVFSLAENLSELRAFSGSKYAQADKGDVLKKVEIELKNEKKCLFIGTPCEVAALKKYLGKDYQNLFTAQLVCMGVSSPLLFKEFVKTKAKERIIKRIVERSSECNWSCPILKIEYSDGSISRYKYISTLWSYAVKTVGRLSCYECRFKGNQRVADLTIGDYWGANNKDCNYEENGMSFICSHTDKGLALLHEISNKIVLKHLENVNARKNNPYIYISRSGLDRRNLYLGNYQQYGFRKGSYKTMTFSDKCKWEISKFIPLKMLHFIRSIVKR